MTNTARVIYFDSNVFTHICNLSCDVTVDGVAKLQQAVDSGKITIPASYQVLEETIPILRRSEKEYEEHIQTVFGLINKDTIIKSHSQLVIEDCISYAYRRPQTPRMEKTPKNFRDIFDLSINKGELEKLTDEIHNFGAGRATDFQAHFDDWLDEMKQKDMSGYESFQETWDAVTPSIIKIILSRLDRTARRLCKKHGFKGMLDIKSIRIGMIYHCWFFYTHWLKTDGTPAKVKSSEHGDFIHSICASAADIFVTQEHKTQYGKLPYILNQMPIKGFAVMNLKDFVATL